MYLALYCFPFVLSQDILMFSVTIRDICLRMYIYTFFCGEFIFIFIFFPIELSVTPLQAVHPVHDCMGFFIHTQVIYTYIVFYLLGPPLKGNIFFTYCVCCCCLPCNHWSNWTWVVEEILAFWYQAAFYALQGV